MKLPKADSTNLLTQKLNKELLIFNTLTNKAYTLNETSMIVFNHCDGATTFDELKAKHQYPNEIIFLALDNLQKENLLAAGSYVSPFTGANRREIIRKIGLASMIALPVICSLVAPTAAHAASSATAACQPCTQASECASGRCTPSSQDSSIRICSNGTRSNAAAQPGTSVETADFICPSFGTGYCCSGDAFFTSPNRCTCR